MRQSAKQKKGDFLFYFPVQETGWEKVVRLSDLENLCWILISARGCKFEFGKASESCFPLSNGHSHSSLPPRKAGE